jgi:cytochrome P450
MNQRGAQRRLPACPAVHFDHRDPAQTVATVNDYYRELLAMPAPVWSDAYGGFWILAHYADVRAAAADNQRYSSALGVFNPAIPGAPQTIPLEMDPPEHRPYRRLFNDWLSPGHLQDYKPAIHELTDHYVTQFVVAGGGDFVSQVANRLPIQVIGRALGLDPGVAEELWALSDRITRGDESTLSDMTAMVHGEIMCRRTRPRSDFLTSLLDARIDDQAISDEKLLTWVLGAIFAGHDTTLLAGAALMKDLATDTQLQELLRKNPAKIPAAVEESLRLNSPVQRFFRTLTDDVEISGTTMRAGDKVLLAYAAANIDADRFSNPETFDVDRPHNRHLAFGHGIHRCVGAPLAVLELTDLAETMLARSSFTISAPALPASPTMNGNFLGLEKLPLAVTRT